MGNKPYTVYAGDPNGDGKSEIAAFLQQGGNMAVLIGNGNGTFQTDHWRYGFRGYSDYLYSMAPGDFNDDGLMDFISVAYAHYAVILHHPLPAAEVPKGTLFMIL